MTDAFDAYSSDLSGPITDAVAVIPSDSADLPAVSRAIYIGGAGHLKVSLKASATPVVFSNLPAGWHPIRVTRVWSTGSTASGIVAGW